MHHLCHIIPSSSSAYKDHTRVRIIGRPDPVSVVCCTAAPRFLRRRVFPQINLPPTHKRSPVSTFHHSTPLSPEHQSKTLVKHRLAYHHHHHQQQPHHITIRTILIIINCNVNRKDCHSSAPPATFSGTLGASPSPRTP